MVAAIFWSHQAIHQYFSRNQLPAASQGHFDPSWWKHFLHAELKGLKNPKSFVLFIKDLIFPHFDLIDLSHFEPKDHRDFVAFLYLIIMSPLMLLALVDGDRFAEWVEGVSKVGQFKSMVLKLPFFLKTDQIWGVEGLDGALFAFLLHEEKRYFGYGIILKADDEDLVLSTLQNHDLFVVDSLEGGGWILEGMLIEYLPIFVTMNKDFLIEISTA